MNNNSVTAERQRIAFHVVSAACAAMALLMSGCASTRGGNPFAAAPWSPIDTYARAIPASAIEEGQTIVAAWVDADVSSPNVIFSVVPGAFSAVADGTVRFAPCGEPRRATSWSELKAVLETRPAGDGAVGLLFTVAGQPAIVPKMEPSPAMRSFLRAFLNGVDAAGIHAVLLVATRFEVVEWRPEVVSPESAFELAPEPPPAPAAEPAPVAEPAPAVESTPEPEPEPVSARMPDPAPYEAPAPMATPRPSSRGAASFDPFSGRSDWEF